MRDKKVWTMVWTLALFLAGVGVGSASANTFTIGQNLTNRTFLDAPGYLFAAESFGFKQGTVDQWSIRSNAGGWGGGTRTITPVIFEQTGTGGLGAFTIRGIGTTRTFSHSASPQTFAFGLNSGSAQMGPRHYFGWLDGDGAGNASSGTISYDYNQHFTLLMSPPGAISVGGTHPVAHNQNRRYSLQATFDIGPFEAVGNGANQRSNTDGGSGGVFVLDDPFTHTGYVTEWAFWSWTDGTRSITPLIFEEVGGSYLLRGVGTSRLVPTNQGTITYDFDLQSGSAVVDANYYFGWVDALIDYATGNPTNNAGLVTYAADEFFTTKGRWLGSNHGAGEFLPGIGFGGGQLLDRAYSIQAIAVPEPATLSLLGLGALALLRRRRRPASRRGDNC